MGEILISLQLAVNFIILLIYFLKIPSSPVIWSESEKRIYLLTFYEERKFTILEFGIVDEQRLVFTATVVCIVIVVCIAIADIFFS